MLKRQCILCGGVVDDAKGIIIRDNFICAGCEQKMISTSMDSVLYRYYVKGLKRIWRWTVA